MLGTESEIRERLERQSFVPTKGGYQIKTVYLGEDLVVCAIKRRDPIFWNDARVRSLSKKPLVGPVYAWARKQNRAFMFHLKQAIKFLVAVVLREPAAGPMAMQRTLYGYRLFENLNGLMDPFMILERVKIKTPYTRVTISPAIVKERSDKTLLDELRELAEQGKMEEANKRIEETMALDQKIWEKRLCNLDFSFKNYRTRGGKVVLRDAGSGSDHYEDMVHFLETLHGLHGPVEECCNPIQKNTRRLSLLSPSLSEAYRKRALEVYTVENFKVHWLR